MCPFLVACPWCVIVVYIVYFNTKREGHAYKQIDSALELL